MGIKISVARAYQRKGGGKKSKMGIEKVIPNGP
jgi:hypothetical protein